MCDDAEEAKALHNLHVNRTESAKRAQSKSGGPNGFEGFNRFGEYY